MSGDAGPGSSLGSADRGYNVNRPGRRRVLRRKEKEVGLVIFFILFGLLILAATGHMILR